MSTKQQPRLFYQLLDDYFNALTAKELPSDTAVPRQVAIDDARLSLVNEYELFAGKGAAADIEIRHKVASAVDNMRRKLSELTCPRLVARTVTADPIHEHVDGSWWFWDETWADELGPFKDRPEAQKECDTYANQLLGPQWSDPPNKRGDES
jgi:hypothetical protein